MNTKHYLFLLKYLFINFFVIIKNKIDNMQRGKNDEDDMKRKINFLKKAEVIITKKIVFIIYGTSRKQTPVIIVNVKL